MKQFQEVAPPGWGHTKSDKEKGVEKGGSAAAFDRARKEGRFKGSKEDMFKLMWWMKNKGGKPKGEPHYKPGTDKKKKKYQDEDWKPEIEVIDTKKEAKKREKKRKEAESSLPPHLRLDAMKKAFAHTNESAVLDANTKIKKDEKKKKQEAELRRLLQHAIAVKRGQAESFEIDKAAHKKVQKKAKLRNLAKGNMNPNEKEAAEKKAGGPKLAFEGWQDKAREAMKRVVSKKKDAPKHDYGRDAGVEARKKLEHSKRKKDHETVNFLDPDD